MTDNRYSAVAAERFDAKIAETADRLRHMAEEVERDGRARKNFMRKPDDRPDYIYAAQRVIHTVTWGLANLNLDGLVSVADEVHFARTLDADQTGGAS
jgi:hypothetical protein